MSNNSDYNLLFKNGGSKMRKILIRHLFICAFIFASLSAMAAFPNYPQPNDWTTNGTVRDIKSSGSKIYIAGDFTYVGPLTGGGTAIATDTAKVNTSYPTVNGIVYAVISDNDGGFYIGGDFSAAGYETRENIAHILSDGTVDSDFNIALNGIVRAIVLSPNAKTLYLGGDFTTVAGTARKRLAAVKLDTCTLTDWAPEANNLVRTLTVSPDGTIVYVGGLFTSIGGTTRNRIAALNSDDGSLLDWDPDSNNSIFVIRVSSDGSLIYVGGQFTTIAGESRKHLAAIKTDGTASSFDPSPNSTVNQIIISQDGTILRISGAFTTVSDTARKHIAFINIADGSLTLWSLATINGVVDNIAVSTDEKTLYIAGHFTSVASKTRRYIASLNISDGTLNDWNPGAENTVSVLAVSSDGSEVYAGGTFISAGGNVRNRLAAIDISTDTLLDWHPNANGAVHSLEFSSDKLTFFTGGAFTSIGGASRDRIAQIGVLSGNANSWDPGADGIVKSIQASSNGNTVYVGGFFQNIGGSAKAYLAALSVTTGSATSWAPSPDYHVYSMRLGPGGTKLYVGGDFKKMGSQDLLYIASVSTATGTAEAWASTANGTVRCLALTSDGKTLYAGGKFTSICGKTRNRIAAITASEGTSTTWNPSANNDVYSLKLSPYEKQIYAGGTFTSIGAATRKYAASLSTSTSTATSWNPNANNTTLAFAISGDENTLFAGGSFTTIAGQKCQYLAGFKSGDYHLTVENGSGDGNYASKTVVDIKADIPPAGHYFEKWTGSTSALSDTTTADSKATIPSSDITVKANYKALTYTITFTAGTNGSIKGTSPQTVSYGNSTNSVSAVPNTDYRLENWTGTGGVESEDNPIKITNVSEDMDMTANFASANPSASLTASSDPEVGGTTNPSGTNDTIVDRPLTITATPADGYHFVSWTGSDNADISDTFSSSTTATISADATITANFATTPAEAILTIDVSPAGSGETTPSGTTTVNTEEAIDIVATANDGFYFLEWTYSSGSVTVANTLSSTTTATLYGDATVTANFAEIPDETVVTTGKIYPLDASDVTGIANFAKPPQAYAQYTDPVSTTKIKKARLKNRTKIEKSTAVESVNMEWSSKFPLLSRKLWTLNKNDTTLEVLASNPPTPPSARLYVKAVDSDGAKTDKYVETTIDLYETQPEITGIYNENGQRITAASAGQAITIRGTLFGTRIPKVWIEYKDKKSVVKKINLKVDRKLLSFPNYKGNAGKSAMDIDTGESTLTVYMPAKWSKSWTHIGDHNIVISNPVCRATIQFSTLP
jgi:List-Bact-rpt repeat protein/beta-propeller uncharacterized protein DUF5122